jgi:hypothetical protein
MCGLLFSCGTCQKEGRATPTYTSKFLSRCACLLAGVLGPEVKQVNLRMSPAFCSAQFGAVPATDWRDMQRYGPTDMAIGLRLQRDGITFKVAN